MGKLPGEESVAGGPLTQLAFLVELPELESGRGVAPAPPARKAAAERRMVMVLRRAIWEYLSVDSGW